MLIQPATDGFEVISRSAEVTASIGEAVGRRLRPDDVVLLFGDLGSGKTTFVQGLARAVEAREPVTSPTFTLIHEYHGRDLVLVHVDPYRLDSPEDVVELGFLDYLGHGAIIAVEWADRLGDLAPQDALSVQIEQTAQDERRVRIAWKDTRMRELAADLEALP